MIIGLVGSISSGKDTVAELLSYKLKCPIYSFSGILKEKLELKNVPTTRENYQDLGDKLRKENGPFVLSKIILERAKENCFIMNGFRNPEEIKFVKKQRNDFVLISIDAPQKIRFERMMKRKRLEGISTFEEFQEREKRDMGDGKIDYKLNTSECMEMCDYNIYNDGNRDDLEIKVDNLIKKLNL